jgi:hypothetical protein
MPNSEPPRRQVREVGQHEEKDPVGERERPGAAAAGVRAPVPQLLDEPAELAAVGPVHARRSTVVRRARRRRIRGSYLLDPRPWRFERVCD